MRFLHACTNPIMEKAALSPWHPVAVHSTVALILTGVVMLSLK